MNEKRQELLGHLDAYYRSCGWPVERAEDGTVRATGAGAVIWIGVAVVPEDLSDTTFGSRLEELSRRHMPSGERCPLELLPAEECAAEVRALLVDLGLADLVSVYSLAAAA